MRLREAPLKPVAGRSVAAPAPHRWIVRTLVAAVALLSLSTTAFAIGTFAPTVFPIKSTAESNAVTERTIRRVATRFGDNLLTWDYRSLGNGIAQLRRDTTNAFAGHYSSALQGTLSMFEASIAAAKSSSTAEVKGVDITSRDADTATVLVLVSRTVQSASKPQPATQLIALELSLVKQQGAWKVDNAATAANPNT